LLALRYLVGHEVSGADAPEAEGFIGAGEIAVGGVEVMVFLVAGPELHAARAALFQPLAQLPEVRHRKTSFSISNGSSLPASRSTRSGIGRRIVSQVRGAGLQACLHSAGLEACPTNDPPK